MDGVLPDHHHVSQAPGAGEDSSSDEEESSSGNEDNEVNNSGAGVSSSSASGSAKKKRSRVTKEQRNFIIKQMQEHDLAELSRKHKDKQKVEQILDAARQEFERKFGMRVSFEQYKCKIANAKKHLKDKGDFKDQGLAAATPKMNGPLMMSGPPIPGMTPKYPPPPTHADLARQANDKKSSSAMRKLKPAAGAAAAANQMIPADVDSHLKRGGSSSQANSKKPRLSGRSKRDDLADDDLFRLNILDEPHNASEEVVTKLIHDMAANHEKTTQQLAMLIVQSQQMMLVMQRQAMFFPGAAQANANSSSGASGNGPLPGIVYCKGCNMQEFLQLAREENGNYYCRLCKNV